MARQRTFIGIGEAILAESPQRIAPAGLAIEVAGVAAALGHRGVPISRLGQDALANELLTQLEAIAAGVPTIDRSHFQSDPDLHTGRLIVRSIAGTKSETLDQRAAFDNMQWDFDLVDLAKQADAVFFGMLAQRYGQSRSIIIRFLSEATGALAICDLTNRADESFDRAHALRSLELAQIAVIDATAWSLLKFGRSDIANDKAAQTLMREASGGLSAVVWLDPNQPMEVHTKDTVSTGQSPMDQQSRIPAIVGLVHAMLDGHETDRAILMAEQIAKHAREHQDQPFPDDIKG